MPWAGVGGRRDIKRIVVLTTGGTIATQAVGGARGDPAPEGGGPAPGRAGGGIWDPCGYAGAHADLKRRGFLFAHNLPGHKARLKLMLALGSLKGAAL